MRSSHFAAVSAGLAAALMASGSAAAQTGGDDPSSWSDAYIGLSGGYAEASDVDVEFSDGFSPALNTDADGGAYGLRAGYDWEWSRIRRDGPFNRLVAGVLIDAHWTDIGEDTDIDQTSFNVAEPPCGGPDGGTDCFVEEQGSAGFDLDHYATLRARVGSAGDRFYAYVTGGLAYASAEFEGDVSTAYSEDAAEALLNDGEEILEGTALPAGCRSVSEPEPTETPVICEGGFTDSRDGYGSAMGVGAEYRLSPSVSLGAEYLHMDFTEGDIDTLTANLNWRF